MLILEGILTTLNADGTVNVSPLGPEVTDDLTHFCLRPYRGGRTYANLLARRAAVFHVTDDALLLARAAVGNVQPPLKPAQRVEGSIIADACRAFELHVEKIDTTRERARLEASVVRREEIRPFLGWNRAKHAVLEAAILTTRRHLLPLQEIRARLQSLQVLVDKTGGPDDKEAFQSLCDVCVDDGHAGPSCAPVRRAGLVKGDAPQQHPDDVCVRVRTGARLHFGLLVPSGDAARRFGGAGLMVDAPRLEVTARPATEFLCDGEGADRVAAFAARYAGGSPPSCHISVTSSFPGHVGLGSGTQIGLAVAAALDRLAGGEKTVRELAAHVGRGARSAVGLYGFDRGGLIVESGKSTSTSTAALVGRYTLPDDWRVLVVLGPGQPGRSGSEEEAAFAMMPAAREQLVDRLSALLLLGIIPALREADCGAFGEALYEYGIRAGEFFASAQGGAFASPAVEAVVRFLRGRDARGVGQSSWGPAVYAVVEDEAKAMRLCQQVRSEFDLAPHEAFVTKQRTTGAEITSVSGQPSLHTLTLPETSAESRQYTSRQHTSRPSIDT